MGSKRETKNKKAKCYKPVKKLKVTNAPQDLKNKQTNALQDDERKDLSNQEARSTPDSGERMFTKQELSSPVKISNSLVKEMKALRQNLENYKMYIQGTAQNVQ